MIALPGLGTLRLLGVAIVAAGLIGGAAYVKGRADGRALGELSSLKETIKEIRERMKDDAATQRLSDFDVCVRDLGRVPECDALR